MKVKRNCLACGKEIEVWQSQIEHGEGKFCSYKCRSIGVRARRIQCVCLVCGKEFSVPPSYAKKGEAKFCSKECRWAGLTKRERRMCFVCGKDFFVPLAKSKRGRGKFCSHECQGLFNRTRTKVKCLVCKKVFEVLPYQVKNEKGKFCSRKCFSISMRNEITPECLNCGKTFKTYPSKIQKGHGKYCSHRCSCIMKFMPQKTTSIEIKVAAILDILGVSYESQKKIKGICIADFFVPPDLIIEADGDYWHSLRAAKDRDAKKNVLLGFKGYRVLRLTETEINKHPIITRRKIYKAIRERGIL